MSSNGSEDIKTPVVEIVYNSVLGYYCKAAEISLFLT